MKKLSNDGIDFEVNEQASILKYINKLKENQKQQILDKLLSYDNKVLNQAFQRFKSNTRKPTPFQIVNCLDFELEDDCIGYQIIAEGKLAIVISSQQNTGFLDIQLPSKKCLFQLYFERIQSLQNLTKQIHGECQPILIFIMTTSFNHEIIASNLQNSNFYGLKEHQIFFFQQDCLPLLSMDGQILFRNEHQIYEEHIGNGQIYLSKHILETMKLLGITIIQLCSIENVLCKFGDPYWLGAFTRFKLDLSFKCTQKRNTDEKLPTIVKNDQSLLHLVGNNNSIDLENNDIQIRQVDKLDGVIGQALCSLDYALNLSQNYRFQLQTNFPIRLKKCTYFDYKLNQLIQPQLATSNALKFEITYYDALPYCSSQKFGLFRVKREDEYAAIINNSNDNKDTAQTARIAYLKRDQKWITQLGYHFDLEIEISPQLTYFGEGLHETLQKIDINKIKDKSQLNLSLDNKELKMVRGNSDNFQIKQNIKGKNLGTHLTKSVQELQNANVPNLITKEKSSFFQLPLGLQKQTNSSSRTSLYQKSDTYRDEMQTEKCPYFENNFRQNAY
ncbi:unnamed protein product (macronuclear) [Paramecium tetraurelia]|uniref:Uncharacterized protein n=1 Tax=Paramecium tetraurelia TaxID=5888 RepID=A0DC97_PARTE|nr:uncharacterized protein GSPATT00015542001 [Paramecium tetraurelia]CAK80664.1 unnamed protein product [Paramecium tetraurelia]|eukprot:XP_001448061.1 hypothetical protein (macronuclear) [Paramecium tetraurelia strain d4-2]